MTKEDFALLRESLEQAVAFKNGKKAPIRTETKVVTRCAIYSPSRSNAERILVEIAKENNGIFLRTLDFLTVETGSEIWEWINPRWASARGRRVGRALIDRRCTFMDYHYIILPGFVGKESDIEFFE
jgi:hypothetical protein